MALGGDTSAPTLTEPVTIKIPAGSQSGRKLRLKGKGLPKVNGGGSGHLYVQLNVVTPTALSRSQRELLSTLEQSFSDADTSADRRTDHRSWWQRLFD